MVKLSQTLALTKDVPVCETILDASYRLKLPNGAHVAAADGCRRWSPLCAELALLLLLRARRDPSSRARGVDGTSSADHNSERQPHMDACHYSP